MNANKINSKFIIYGLGSRGKSVIDYLLFNDIKTVLIIDQHTTEDNYKGIEIQRLSNLKSTSPLDHYECIVTLHNNYVNLKCVYQDIKNSGINNIRSLIYFNNEHESFNVDNGYWLEKKFKYSAFSSEINTFKSMLYDDKSKHLLDSIVRYRDFGGLIDCPDGSFLDEYIPQDLPRYLNPIRLIDCGSYDGLAIRKFIKAGYIFNSLICLEPDPKNYGLLEGQNFDIQNLFLLPLGAWSSTTQLRFSSDKDMGSSVNDNGNVLIQCASIDSLAKNFHPTLMKFDVEGAEIEALLGAKETICVNKPNLCVSLYHRADHLFKIPLLINSWHLNYRFYLRVHEENTFGVVLYCLNHELLSP